MDEHIPMIAPQNVPMFSPYTAGRNNLHNMQKAIEIETITEFDQTPVPDKIETYVDSNMSAPIEYSETKTFSSSNDNPLLQILFKILKYIFIFLTAIFASKSIMKYIQNENYNQVLMLTGIFFSLSYIFEWSFKDNV